MFGLKLRRSGGVAVTRAVHGRIAAGNAARDRRDWGAAVHAYEQALADDPALGHIWVQLGHAAKEAGDAARAAAAYARAAVVAPGAADPHLHLGHLARDAGDGGRAARHYLDAAKIEPGHGDAVAALHTALGRAGGTLRDEILAFLRADLVTEPVDAIPPPRPDATTVLVFDASDLIAYFRHARLPTGIQRVQIEAITRALDSTDETRDVRICCFLDGRDDWLEVPPGRFRDLVALSVAGGGADDPAWVAAVGRLRLGLMLGPAFVWSAGAVLVNLGTSWWLQNYFLYVRHAKATAGIRYVPFVHDLIPVMTPEHCVTGLTRDFIAWLLGVFAHADHFLANSEATKRDLITVAGTLGVTLTGSQVSVVRLDADFRRRDEAPLPASALSRWGLAPRGFMLFVSTIESRKGHVVALDALAGLLARHGPERLPKLVCVGNPGWLNEPVHRRLAENPALAAHVLLLSGLADADLALLYRTCRFTLYPSLYEGWGLPVTEALAHGKAVIAADGSSLPEAGGAFATYVATGSTEALAGAIERLAFDDAALAAVEARIAAGFRPRSWAGVAEEIAGYAAAVAATPARPFHPPVARAGASYALGRAMATRIWRGAGAGEVFRGGLGWDWPDAEGCGLREGGGALAIGVEAAPGEPVTLHLALRNPSRRARTWSVAEDAGTGRNGTAAAGERRWVNLDLTVPADGVLRVRMSDAAIVERVADRSLVPDDDRHVAVDRFVVHAAGDAEARARFVEAVALGALADIDGFGEAVEL